MTVGSSLCSQCGEDAASVKEPIHSERLGHSSISMTLDVYSAVLPNIQREAVERLAEMFEAR